MGGEGRRVPDTLSRKNNKVTPIKGKMKGWAYRITNTLALLEHTL